ncbi:MAG: TIGR02710 family CRISPR-associated CARF protein [Thermodesulfobacteriota bacterium]
MNTKTILICTVGGSHQPIVTAIRDLRPDFVCFICSGKDPGTGKAGSDTQVLGKGRCIKANYNDEKASLPNIPTQAGLAENSYEVVTVPADDLDGAVVVVREALVNLGDQFTGARLVADYTGGTKTMTAALVAAVLETDGVDLQLVTGNRADLVKVRNGTEASVLANIDAVRLQRGMAPYLSAWGHFAYDESADGLASIPQPRDRVLGSRLSRSRDLSNAFAAWDRFDHAEALRLLEIYAAVVSGDLGRHLGALKLLVKKSDQQEPMRIFDLWRNAERRAAQGRYDDAVARVYRLIEWSAQWLLRLRCGINTSDIPPERIPVGVDIPANRDGMHQAGLYAAWLMVGKLTSGPASGFTAAHLPALLGHLQIRNESILAHGFSSVEQGAWEDLRNWMDGIFLPMLLEEIKAMRLLHTMPPQLPSVYIWNN